MQLVEQGPLQPQPDSVSDDRRQLDIKTSSLAETVRPPEMDVRIQGESSGKPLTTKEHAALRAFVRALAVAPRVLDADLDAASRLNMADYHVLVLLSEQPDHAIGMNELAAQAILTPSGLTRVIERLNRRGLVERTHSEIDGRAQVARLTEVGWQTVVAAYPPHLQSVRTRVMRHLRGLDLAAFTHTMECIAEEVS